MKRNQWAIIGVIAVALLLAVTVVGRRTGTQALPGDLRGLVSERGLTPDQVSAALQTFVPPGKYDDYLMFASGGQSGQMLVFGLPSMRLLRVIGVFAPEPWQGDGRPRCAAS